MSEVRSLGRLWTGMVLMYPLAAHLPQYWSSLYLHPVSILLLSCFYRASLCLLRSPWVWGTLGGVMVSKLNKQTFTSEFESHWAPHSVGLVPHRSKKLGRPYARSICSIFSPCMESNALEKSTNKRVASRFLSRTAKIRWIVRCCGSISTKAILVFPKNFLNFRFNAVE